MGREKWQALSLEEKREAKRAKQRLAIKIWGMYVTDGKSMTQIANELELHPARVSMLIDFAARRITKLEHPETYVIKLKEVQRLQALIDGVWKKVLPGLEDSGKELGEDQREAIKTYNELTKRLDKLMGLNAPVKMAHQIQRIEAPRASPETQVERLIPLIERLMSRGMATPEEIAFYQAKKLTPVSNGNQKQLVQGGAIGGEIIDAEVVNTKPKAPEPVDIHQDKVTEHGELQLALFRTGEGSEG